MKVSINSIHDAAAADLGGELSLAGEQSKPEQVGEGANVASTGNK